MHKAKSSMEDIDTENPGQAIMGLLSSGVIQDMVVGLQQGVSSGEMDMQKLLGSMQSAIGAIIPASTGVDNSDSSASALGALVALAPAASGSSNSASVLAAMTPPPSSSLPEVEEIKDEEVN